MAAPEPVNLAAALGGLRPKGKQPNSARVLNVWIAQAEQQLGSDGGRLGRLVASTIATAALQLAVDELGEPLFLLKGGTLLQHRVPGTSRATTDLDGLILDIFHARARDAAALGLPPRTWPTALTPFPHWRVSFVRAAESVGLDIGLEDAVEQVNTWIKLIDGA